MVIKVLPSDKSPLSVSRLERMCRRLRAVSGLEDLLSLHSRSINFIDTTAAHVIGDDLFAGFLTRLLTEDGYQPSTGEGCEIVQIENAIKAFLAGQSGKLLALHTNIS
jgi:hypothetical protein